MSAQKSYPLVEFCANFRIPYAPLMAALHRGRGPKTCVIGGRVRVFASAAAEWAREHAQVGTTQYEKVNREHQNIDKEAYRKACAAFNLYGENVSQKSAYRKLRRLFGVTRIDKLSAIEMLSVLDFFSDRASWDLK